MSFPKKILPTDKSSGLASEFKLQSFIQIPSTLLFHFTHTHAFKYIRVFSYNRIQKLWHVNKFPKKLSNDFSDRNFDIPKKFLVFLYHICKTCRLTLSRRYSHRICALPVQRIPGNLCIKNSSKLPIAWLKQKYIRIHVPSILVSNVHFVNE